MKEVVTRCRLKLSWVNMTSVIQGDDKKRFLITGGSGFIGSRLVPVLLEQGHDVTVLTRNPDKTAQHFNHAVTTVERPGALNDTEAFDVVINLAGQGITDKRWTPGIQKQLHESLIITNQKLINQHFYENYGRTKYLSNNFDFK